MKFKVGDRVRIVCPMSNCNGREGTIWKVMTPPVRKWSEENKAAGARWWHAAYLVDVDGFGRAADPFGGKLGFPHFYLRKAVRDPEASRYIASIKSYDATLREDAPCWPEI